MEVIEVEVPVVDVEVMVVVVNVTVVVVHVGCGRISVIILRRLLHVHPLISFTFSEAQDSRSERVSNPPQAVP